MKRRRISFMLACLLPLAACTAPPATGTPPGTDAAAAMPATTAPAPVAEPPRPAALPSGAVAGGAVIGGRGEYVVRPGDNLTLVAARLGARLPQLWAENALDASAFLRVGQRLVIDNPHIAPPAPVAGGTAVLVNIPQRMLFVYRDGALLGAYPVAVGRADWPTPEGDTTIETRQRDKAWIVPRSIQAEMREHGQPVLTRVEPGPDNPLGAFWLGLDWPGYGIHGTNAPASVYGVRTHGCLRLQAEHIEAVYAQVAPGTPVRVIYAPVLLYAAPAGPIWLEAHPDAYGRGLDYPQLARALAGVAGVTDRINWNVAASVWSDQLGLARDVSLLANSPETPGTVPLNPPADDPYAAPLDPSCAP